jgi:hypothetical protein
LQRAYLKDLVMTLMNSSLGTVFDGSQDYITIPSILPLSSASSTRSGMVIPIVIYKAKTIAPPASKTTPKPVGFAIQATPELELDDPAPDPDPPVAVAATLEVSMLLVGVGTPEVYGTLLTDEAPL